MFGTVDTGKGWNSLYVHVQFGASHMSSDKTESVSHNSHIHICMRQLPHFLLPVLLSPSDLFLIIRVLICSSFGVHSLPCSIFSLGPYYIFYLSLHIAYTHLRIAYHIFSIMFAIPAFALISSVLIFSILFIPTIHLNISIYVLSGRF